MRLSLGGAVQSREATQKLRMFSKQWEPGSTVRAYYRTYIDPDTTMRQLLAGSCWGHKVNDMNKLGLKTTFIPSLCDYDENGDPVGAPDILNRFSRLAPLFIEGEKSNKLRVAERKEYPQEALRRDAIKIIENEYDTKNNRKAIKPVISRPTLLITVEVLVVPFKDDKPQMDAMVVACQPVSNKIAKQLDSILRNQRYAAIDEHGFLEVEWAFPMDTDKGNSGANVVPVGLDEKFAFRTQFPELYPQLVSAFAGVADDSEMIRRRATSGVAEQVIRQAITNYSFLNSESLGYCMDEETLTEGVMKNVDLLKELDVARAVSNPLFTERYNKALAERVDTDLPAPQEVDEPVSKAPVAGVTAPEPAPATTAGAAPTITQLLEKQGQDADTSLDDVMDGVDLGAFANTPVV